MINYSTCVAGIGTNLKFNKWLVVSHSAFQNTTNLRIVIWCPDMYSNIATAGQMAISDNHKQCWLIENCRFWFHLQNSYILMKISITTAWNACRVVITEWVYIAWSDPKHASAARSKWTIEEFGSKMLYNYPFLCIQEKCSQSLEFTGKCIRKGLDSGS
jgi:hypothetical protein